MAVFGNDMGFDYPDIKDPTKSMNDGPLGGSMFGNAAKKPSGSGYNHIFDTSQIPKGYNVINIKSVLDPRKTDEDYNVYGKKNPFDITEKANNFFKQVLAPMDKWGKKITNNKMLGKVFAQIPGQENEKPLSERIADSITNNISFDGAAYIQKLDEEIISKKFPFISGLTSDMLDAYMMPPGEHYDTNKHGYVAWKNAKQDRLVAEVAKDNYSPMVAAASGVNLSPVNQFVFNPSGGRDTLTFGDAALKFNASTDQFGKPQDLSSIENNAKTAMQPKEAMFGSKYADVLANNLSNNFRRKNKTYDELMDLAEAADPLWDIENRHTIAWNGLQKAKETGVKLLDGSGDYLKEEWDNFGLNARNKIENAYNQLDDFVQGNNPFGIMLNPKLKQNLDKWMNKMGFAKRRGVGSDIEGNPSEEIMYSTVVNINGVEIQPEDFMGFYEEHDYVRGKFPLRKIKVRITPTYKDNGLDLDEIAKTGKMKVAVGRSFAFSRSQNYDLFTINGNAIFRAFETLQNFDGVADVSKFQTPPPSKKKTKDKVETATKEETGATWGNATEVLEITLTSPHNVLMNNPKALFQGVTKEGTTVKEVINEAFKLHFMGKGDDASSFSPGNSQYDTTGFGDNFINYADRKRIPGGNNFGPIESYAGGMTGIGVAGQFGKVKEIDPNAGTIENLAGGLTGVKSGSTRLSSRNNKGDGIKGGIEDKWGNGSYMGSLMGAGKYGVGTQTGKAQGLDTLSGNLQLAMEEPEFNIDFSTIKTPMDFRDTVEYYQRESGGMLYNGGYNIFQDDKIIYIVRRKGPNKIEFADDWKTILRFSPQDAKQVTQSLYTLSSVSERKVWIGLNNDDIMYLGDFSDYNEQKTIPIFAGVPSIFNNQTENSPQNTTWMISHLGSAVEANTSVKKVQEFIVRIPNTYLIFRPGDNIKIEMMETKEVYTGTVKRWAAQQGDAMTNVRAVVLQLALKEGEEANSDEEVIENSPVNKAIKKYQEWTAKTSDKFAAKIEKLQSRLIYAKQNEKQRAETVKILNFQSSLLYGNDARPKMFDNVLNNPEKFKYTYGSTPFGTESTSDTDWIKNATKNSIWSQPAPKEPEPVKEIKMPSKS